MIEEIWKDIKDYEGLYQVSNYGQVKSLKRKYRLKERILRGRKGDKYNHLIVSLFKNNIPKNHIVHRLVLETFIGPCPPGMEGCHNDGNVSNNFIGNLRWDTRLNNARDAIKHKTNYSGSKHFWAKLNEKQVKIIKWLLKDGYLTIKEIANAFNVSYSIINHIKNKRSWKSV